MTTWTSVRDQKLFLLFLKHVKVDNKTIAADWKASYGKWPLSPTPFRATHG
jgi:hypothetical protein